jgi:hypothetical protein
MAANRLYTPFWRLLLVACFTLTGLLASESHGVVKSGGLPVPGATVTATQGDKKVVTTTDDTGYYSFPELADGVWTVTVDALGFVTAKRDIGVTEAMPGPEWDLQYQTLDAIANPTKPEASPTAPAAGTAPTSATAGTTPAAANATPATPNAPATAPATAAATPPAAAAKGRGANANGRPSLNAALAGQGQGGGFTRVNVGQTGDGLTAQDMGQQDMGDMTAQGNDSFTINGSVSSGLGMAQPGGDWMAGGRGGPGGFGPDMGGGMGGPGGPGGGNPGDPNAQFAGAGGPGGPGGGGPGGGGRGGGGPGGGGGRGGGGMMAGMPNIGGGGRGGRGRGGPGGRNPAAFGNNRRDPRSRYNFSASLNNFTNAVLDARPFSESGNLVAKPDSQTIRATLTAGGPLKIPHIFDTKGKGTFTINYSFTRNRNALPFTDTVPTAAEEQGNFSSLLGSTPQTLIYPLNSTTGAAPFPGNIIPASEISTFASTLQKYFPAANSISAFNYAASAAGHTNADNINARLSYTFNTKNQISGGVQWQRQDTTTPSVFSGAIPGWYDGQTANGIALNNLSYIYHINVHLINTLRYNYNRASQLRTPYFSNLSNVEGALGITGVDTYPINWGPPTVNFTGSSILGISDTTLQYAHPQTSAIGDSLLWVHQAHEFTFGGDFSRRQSNLLSQSNPRGTLQFSGAQTALNGDTSCPKGSTSCSGNDYADFLLGAPYAMSINYTNLLDGAQGAQYVSSASAAANLQALADTPSGGDRYLRTSVYDIYATDSWHLTPRISLLIGLRWDYQAPSTELYGRLATVDMPASFQVPASLYNSLPDGLAVVAGQTGPATGIHYSNSILNGQKTDVSPRLGIAYKPWSKHSTVIRSGWGIYYTPSIYSTLIGQLDSQTPFATDFNLTNTTACGATVQNAFNLGYLQSRPGCLGGTANNTPTVQTTNAINPQFRVGYTSNWQLAVQQNLMANTVFTVDYFGVKGTALPQQFYPNTSPAALDNLTNYSYPGCASGYVCPVGYQYETSNGNSITEGIQVQLQRRLRSGFGWNVSYTFNHSIDDAPTGNTVQNWQDLAAERADTAGIRRNTLTVQFQYSTGVSARGGGLVSGWKGVLFRDWTVMPGLVLASGAPINIYAEQLALGGAPNGNIRVDYLGGPLFLNGILNPNAFGDPPAGTYGTLGRDAIWGPGTFTTTLNALRTFRLADRKNVTFSVNVINPLNHPSVTAWNTNLEPNATVNSQFGLPTSFVTMRQITANMRFNF